MKFARVQRVKYVKILEILKQESDEYKPLTTTEIIEKLKARGVVVDRKILYEDIKVLNEIGYEIMCNRAKQNEYYIVDRQFDVPELRILMDAVQAASFIPEKKTDELLSKIANLGRSYRKELLLRDNVCFNTNKHSNSLIYYSVNEIEDAINHNKKIQFEYFDLDNSVKKVYRKDKAKYEVSPIATFFSNDNYYLIGYSNQHDGYSNYRIDRMEAVKKLVQDREPSKLLTRFDGNQYRKQLFGMFLGEIKTVMLEFDKSLMDVIFDKFGEKTHIAEYKNNYRVEVEVAVSKQFYGFVLGLDDKIKIIKPNEVVLEFKDYLQKIMKLYKEGVLA